MTAYPIQPSVEASARAFSGLVSVPSALVDQARVDATRVRELEFELKAARIELEITNGELERVKALSAHPLSLPETVAEPSAPECPFCGEGLSVERRDGDLITGNCWKCRETVQVLVG